jgi:hypothetical protein
MVQIDIPWAFLIGSTLADADHVELRLERSAVKSTSFLAGLAFVTILFNPSGMYLLWRYAGWETMYWLGERDVTAMVPTLFLAVLSVMYALGFVFGHRKLRQNQRRSLRWINTVVSLAILLFLAVSYRRFLFVGTYQEFAAGAAPNIVGNSLFRDLGIMGLLLAPSYLYIYGYFQRRGEKISAGRPPAVERHERMKILLKATAIGWGALAGGAVIVLLVQRLLLR